MTKMTEFTSVQTMEKLLQDPVGAFDFMPIQFDILRQQGEMMII